ncbi:AAA family ATPase [Succinivibrio faecicola]|uniref:AAA family ATPase n=1 Tax=Succinivibrio faecicola TaxID=2820300 RepID=A0ABS7DDV9_9GAMM|nr:AAA family ATPase [Succinivibrio faecicola]MBW7569484.1 AAA family ATPase [Succinivibrio faecicola]
MSERNLKRLPLGIGNDSFIDIITKGGYYVDKSLYLKTVFTNISPVILFTRPRRFGKTLLMDMFKSFLRVAPDGSANREYKEKLFDGLEILNDKEFTDKYLGQFPVISITLKNVYGDTFTEAYEAFAYVISNLSSEFDFLHESNKLLDSEKESLRILQNVNQLRSLNNSFYIKNFLEFLSNCLYKHYSKKVIILIDEYDVPLAKASEKGYHDKMVTLMTSFFNVMKNNFYANEKADLPIEKIVLTGCLKVAKNSIFTGVNNLYVNTILSESPSFDSMIGFTKDETVKILKDYELDDYFPFVKENYDGYRFNKKEMFCPWVLVSFIKDAIEKKSQNIKVNAPNYWINSTSSNALLSYVGYLTDEDNENMQKLMDGECIETTINDSMNYDDLSMHKAEDFYTLLLFTGYLTVDSYRTENISGEDKTVYSLKIPNREIRQCFIKNIKEHFDTIVNQGENKAKLIAKALFEGDSESASDNIFDLLKSYVSIRDFATKAKKENFYHGFLSGIFTNCSNFITDFKSNSESGDGYADLIFMDERQKKVVILEIKAVNSKKELPEGTQKALKQIEEMRYADEYLDDSSVKAIYCYGISFYNKQCEVSCRKIK